MTQFINQSPNTTAKSTIISIIRHALRLAQMSVALGIIAIACFIILGTLSSLNAYRDSALIYYLFHYLPYVLIGMSLPITLYHLFLFMRYRIVQPSIIKTLITVGIGSLIFVIGVYLIQGASMAFYMSGFLAMIAWLGMPYLLRVNLRKFLNFLETSTPDTSQT